MGSQSDVAAPPTGRPGRGGWDWALYFGRVLEVYGIAARKSRRNLLPPGAGGQVLDTGAAEWTARALGWWNAEMMDARCTLVVPFDCCGGCAVAGLVLAWHLD